MCVHQLIVKWVLKLKGSILIIKLKLLVNPLSDFHKRASSACTCIVIHCTQLLDFVHVLITLLG